MTYRIFNYFNISTSTASHIRNFGMWLFRDHYNALESLLRHCIKSSKENTYYSHAFKCLKDTYNKLHTLSNVQCKNE